MIEYIFLALIFLLLIFLLQKNSGFREGYRDPLYMNRAKYAFDYYPRANGSIYGMTYRQGGSWSVASGYPYYDKAY